MFQDDEESRTVVGKVEGMGYNVCPPLSLLVPGNIFFLFCFVLFCFVLFFCFFFFFFFVLFVLFVEVNFLFFSFFLFLFLFLFFPFFPSETRVCALWEKKEEEYYQGIIVDVQKDHKCEILFDDGDKRFFYYYYL